MIHRGICMDWSGELFMCSRDCSLRWPHNDRDGVSNHQPHDCLLNRLLKCRSKKISKLRVTALCEGNSPVTGEFPAQRASNAKNVSTMTSSCIYFPRWEAMKEIETKITFESAHKVRHDSTYISHHCLHDAMNTLMTKKVDPQTSAPWPTRLVLLMCQNNDLTWRDMTWYGGVKYSQWWASQ